MSLDLVTRIRYLDILARNNIPRAISLQKELFKNESRCYPLLEKVINQETSLSSVVEEFAKKYEGQRFFYPTRIDEAFDQRVIDSSIEDILGVAGIMDFKTQFYPQSPTAYEKVVNHFYSKVANPIMLPLFCGGLSSLFVSGEGRYGAIGLGMLLGLFSGSILSWGRKSYIDQMRQRASYLDGKIKQLFSTGSSS